MTNTKFILATLAVALFITGCASKNTPEPEKRFTFSWQYSDNDDMKPRGGVTTGAAVTPDTSPNPAFLAVQEPGLTKYERDRRAILSMAGIYRVTFDFIETVPLRNDYKIDRPYQSWATEYVKVIEDSGNFISLQHILVMYFVDDNGDIQGPAVSKHWRQDWTYEDSDILEYSGNNTWQSVKVPADEAKGEWSQAVYQVDDTPRYEALGEWEFDGNYARWTSRDTWRPLPRREFSVRDDYNVLAGTNRVVITPTGWVHEQNNVKMIVDENGKPVAKNPYLAQETGLNRYERIADFDSTSAVEYWNRTAPFWRDVRESWNEIIKTNNPLKLKSSYENKKLYEYLFEYADRIAEGGEYDSKNGSQFATETISRYVIEPGEGSDESAY